MADSRRASSSLDALLESTREQFDQAFADQLRSADAAGLRKSAGRATAPGGRSPASKSPDGRSSAGGERDGPVAAPAAPAAASSIDAKLTRRFGPDWSAELVETQVTDNNLSALFRLTVEDRSALEFGNADIRDGEEAALETARQMALEKGADALAHGASLSEKPKAQRLPEAPAAATRAAPSPSGVLDSITLDMIEASWRQIRKETGVVLNRFAVSNVVRQKASDAGSLTDGRGAAVIGKPVAAAVAMRQQAADLKPGDVYLQADAYANGGTAGLWTVVVPVFSQGQSGDIVGFSTVSAPMADAGGPTPGSAPNTATSVYAEGVRVPLVRIFDQEGANSAALDIVLGNTRDPEVLNADLRAMAMAAQSGEHAIVDLCSRFGVEAYKQACKASMDRTNKAMRRLIARNLPEEPKSFEDVVDDDGVGNGPFHLKLAIWREGEQAFLDWTGTSPQAEGPINLALDNAGFAAIAGGMLIKLFDPEVAVNDGLQDLFKVTVPAGSLLRPRFPAPLGNQAHTLARVYDVLSGVLGQCGDSAKGAAGYGSSPQVIFAGQDSRGRSFNMIDRVFGGTPGRYGKNGRGKDGQDGQSLSSGSKTRPVEQTESDAPVSVVRVKSIADSGGAGTYRGGNGVEKVYHFHTAGYLSWRDDRSSSQPWGVDGGRAAAGSSKIIIRADGAREEMPSKCDMVRVRKGDRLVFRTAGGGGCGNPLDRAADQVQKEVNAGQVSVAGARDHYGVVLADGRIDEKATRELRETMARSRTKKQSFDFGAPPKT